MSDLRKRVEDLLKAKGIEKRSGRFRRAQTIVSGMKLTDEERAKAEQIAREWVK